MEDAFPGLEIDLIKGKGGAFEVRRDGALIFSKKEVGRFPTHREIIRALEAKRSG